MLTRVPRAETQELPFKSRQSFCPQQLREVLFFKKKGFNQKIIVIQALLTLKFIKAKG